MRAATTMAWLMLLGAALWLAVAVWAADPGAAASANADQSGFKTVSGPCALTFPADHGPHPAYRTEWWYYTGNLVSPSNRRFGFQLTFFRSGLERPQEGQEWPDPASAWRTDQIYLAHAAVSDIDGGRHYQSEQMVRPVLGMAGAQQAGDRVTIHLNAWQTVITPQAHHLKADGADFVLNLTLTPAKGVVLHGEDGYSRKGDGVEEASCYYSFTRLKASGELSVSDARHAVVGTAWMDHEFSTAPLSAELTGWDWFSLQLGDGTEVMIYLLRQAQGDAHPASSGTFVDPAGRTRHLRRDELRVQPLDHWTSPHSGGRYPIRWRVEVVPLALTLLVEANLKEQEMRTPGSTNVSYWEGSVRASGTRGGERVEGVGYVELTGYAAPFDAPM
ncbi:MAG: lipocalin-like domain-containing protein [Desulfosarcinaceae bacterium]|nr:lipocalin-like domain-containing protein [Desulfosarcinaceae bacterium]